MYNTKTYNWTNNSVHIVPVGIRLNLDQAKTRYSLDKVNQKIENATAFIRRGFVLEKKTELKKTVSIVADGIFGQSQMQSLRTI